MASPMPLASAAERRVTLRMLSYWERLRGSRAMPTEEDIDPYDLHDLWDCCFLLHVKDMDKPDYNYTYLGDEILQTLQEGTENEAENFANPEIRELTKAYPQVVLTKKPVLEEGEFITTAGASVKYRQCLLPLGEGSEVLAILGAVRFKVFSLSL